MKQYTKTINGLKMVAYNDSGVEWVINGVRYASRRTTLKRAFEIHAETHGSK